MEPCLPGMVSWGSRPSKRPSRPEGPLADSAITASARPRTSRRVRFACSAPAQPEELFRVRLFRLQCLTRCKRHASGQKAANAAASKTGGPAWLLHARAVQAGVHSLLEGRRVLSPGG